MCSDIGVKLKIVYIDGVNVQVIESFFLKVCKRFVEDLLCQLWVCVVDQIMFYGFRFVILSYVYRVVCFFFYCDFFISMYFGEVLLKDEK